MSYKLRDGGVIRLADNANIPADPLNRDWRAYQAWTAAGNRAAKADPPPPPQRDIAAEVEELKQRIEAVEAKAPATGERVQT